MLGNLPLSPSDDRDIILLGNAISSLYDIKMCRSIVQSKQKSYVVV
jgi:hypothetical protein